MPNDPALYPSIASPEQRIYARVAQLEARLHAVEWRPGPIFTPFRLLWPNVSSAAPTFTYTWNGGPLWIVVGGRMSFPAAGGFGEASLTINGASATLLTANQYGSTGTSQLQQAVGFKTVEVDTAGLSPGTLTLSFGSPVNVVDLDASGLLIEYGRWGA